MIDLGGLRIYHFQLQPLKDFCLMTAECPILTGIFDGFSWIRCEGKGSFMNSPAMKEFGDGRIAAGERCLVVDLGACTGMDSTFMGTLAGMAARLSARDNGVLQIADPGSRNRRSLEDLGLDFILDIDPPTAVWQGNLGPIRDGLRSPNSDSPGAFDRTKHVLEAHQTLSEANEKNAKTFSTVVSMLKAELADQQKPSDKDGGK